MDACRIMRGNWLEITGSVISVLIFSYKVSLTTTISFVYIFPFAVLGPTMQVR